MSQPAPEKSPVSFRSKRWKLFGLDSDDVIRVFFAGNALTAIIILLLITLFLFKEAAGFRKQNFDSQIMFRQSGMQYFAFLQEKVVEYSNLTRTLNAVRAQTVSELMAQGKTLSDANAALREFDDFAIAFEEAGYDFQDIVDELRAAPSAARTKYQVYLNQRALKTNLESEGRLEEAAAIELAPVELLKTGLAIKETLPDVEEALVALTARIQELLKQTPEVSGKLQKRAMRQFERDAAAFNESIPTLLERLRVWNPASPISNYEALTMFFTGTKWVTNSYVQDWYGILPLFMGSFTISMIALAFAVPLGVGAAIYVNQIAKPMEGGFIKPSIEFISAFPSVVIGFLGVVVFGELTRVVSNWEALSWVPFFPIQERLNAFTAGCLLALMAIPTIFTLAEDAIQNVPKAMKEASLAVGATRLQTTLKIIVPTALSGIISAILLGFGRVIGETMVVLLCAGNRIAIPDFTEGFSAFFQPVHTMTGIIAQEMGEVVRGGLHYRALFMVGITLFIISLFVNYVAQIILRRYKMKSSL